MKQIVIVSVLLLSGVSYAEEKEAVSPKLQELAKVVATDQIEKSAEKAAAPKAADVADKALDMVRGAVSSVVDGVSKAAPQVWRVMVRQRYIKAATTVLLPWGLFLLVFAYYGYIKKAFDWEARKAREKEDPRNNYISQDQMSAYLILGQIIPGILWVAFGIWGIVALSDSICYLLNPEYYAIRDMLLMALHPSTASQ